MGRFRYPEKNFQIQNLSTQYFILENFQEFIKVLRILMNVINQILLEQNAVFKFCLENQIKLIYSATSATLGNKGNDKNLSPTPY